MMAPLTIAADDTYPQHRTMLPLAERDELTAQLIDTAAFMGIEGPAEVFELNESEPVRVLKVSSAGETLLIFHLMNSNRDAFARISGEGDQAVMRLWDDGPDEAVFSASGMVIRPRVEGLATIPTVTENGVVENLACLARSAGLNLTGLTDSGLSGIISKLGCSSASAIALVLTVVNCLSVPHPMATVGCIVGTTKLISCGFLNCALCTVTNINIGDTVNNSYDSGCRSSHRTAFAKFYKFSLSQSRTVTIDLTSVADTYLYLLAGNGTNGTVVASDDDSGAGLNSRISRTLSAGTYTIEATTFGTNVTGTFTLSIR